MLKNLSYPGANMALGEERGLGLGHGVEDAEGGVGAVVEESVGGVEGATLITATRTGGEKHGGKEEEV